VTPPSATIVHYVKPDYMRDGRVLDPEHVESLVYVNTDRGAVLAAAMYMMPAARMPGPAIGGPLTRWHSHTNLCFDRAGVIVGFADALDRCAPGTAHRLTPEMLHVWLVDNPDGPFSDDMEPEAVQALVHQ
jgi:hypothetical protein